MKIACILIFALGAALTAHADFSYTTTTKRETRMRDGTLAPAAGAAARPQTVKYYLKGQKIKRESVSGINENTATITDFGAQTVTGIYHGLKTYEVTKHPYMQQGLKEMTYFCGVEAKIDVKETGERRVINGYSASEVLVTIRPQSPDASTAPVPANDAAIEPKWQCDVAEWEMWLSPDMPGIEEWRAFSQKNEDGSLSVALTDLIQGPNPQDTVTLQQASQQGFPVLQVFRWGVMGLPPIETTMESSDFSTSPIPDSVFAIPAGYRQILAQQGAPSNGSASAGQIGSAPSARAGSGSGNGGGSGASGSVAPGSGGAVGRVYHIGGGVSAPSLIYKVEPNYTEEARKSKIQGVVILYVEIDPTGTPSNIKVTRHLDAGLDDKAIEAVKKWKFKPGMRNGQAVTVAASIEINFRLLEDRPQAPNR